ncbi:hypothetical protein [Alysiella filiformis]|nr:hypothetical protein [Alysiella filiformis]QMT31389.1 hypothetical protein H3L97_00260 [Alysiella filiformis]UBQ55602.1 hypothetical protein JF568_08410 [Alysiella filiformis DSM 16848]
MTMFHEIFNHEDKNVLVHVSSDALREKALILAEVSTSLNSVNHNTLGALVLDKYQIERLGTFLTVLEPYLENPADVEVCKSMIKSLGYLINYVENSTFTS